MILKLPNLFSLKGLLTKYLPHPLYVLIYRYVYGKKNASKNDTEAFTRYLRSSIAPAAIKKFAANHGLSVSYFDTYDLLNNDWFQRKQIAHAVYKALKTVLGFSGSGLLTESEYIRCYRK